VFCERDPKVPSRLLCQVCISGYYFRSQYAYWGCQVRVCILRLGSDPNMHIGIRVCVLEPGSPNTHIRMRVRILGHFSYWYRHIGSLSPWAVRLRVPWKASSPVNPATTNHQDDVLALQACIPTTWRARNGRKDWWVAHNIADKPIHVMGCNKEARTVKHTTETSTNNCYFNWKRLAFTPAAAKFSNKRHDNSRLRANYTASYIQK
jgi:hypothetical protein